MSAPSNRLPVLAAEAGAAHADALRYTSLAAERALAAGRLLAEARSLCAHGAWGPFLTEAGISERTAQRYIALARVALTPATVASLGGVAAAAAWASGARLPGPGSCLLIEAPGAGNPPLVLVWPEGAAHHVGHLDLDGEGPHVSVTRRPIPAEPFVWATCWHLLGDGLGDLSLRAVPDDTAARELREVMVGAGVAA